MSETLNALKRPQPPSASQLLESGDIQLSKTISSLDQSIVRIDSMLHGVIAFDDLLNGSRPRPAEVAGVAPAAGGIHSSVNALANSVGRLESALRVLINGKD